jgi:hypothetical protein
VRHCLGSIHETISSLSDDGSDRHLEDESRTKGVAMKLGSCVDGSSDVRGDARPKGERHTEVDGEKAREGEREH